MDNHRLVSTETDCNQEQDGEELALRVQAPVPITPVWGFRYVTELDVRVTKSMREPEIITGSVEAKMLRRKRLEVGFT